MRKLILPILLISIISFACNVPGATAVLATPSAVPSSQTTLPTETFTPTFTFTETTLPSLTPTRRIEPTETITLTPTLTDTPGPSATPTFAFPAVTVNKQAHCRYGPATAYLHAADLYAGDTGSVRGRFNNSKWLYIKFDKLKYFCWVAPTVVDVVGDIKTIKFTDVHLPGPSVLYGPPTGVNAVRDGDKVMISWEVLPMTDDDDRGYLLDIFVCQKGVYFWSPIALENRDKTSYTIKDEAGCPAPSGGRLYGVEKHAYTTPVTINWPQP
jgi:hypothetical protein